MTPTAANLTWIWGFERKRRLCQQTGHGALPRPPSPTTTCRNTVDASGGGGRTDLDEHRQRDRPARQLCRPARRWINLPAAPAVVGPSPSSGCSRPMPATSRAKLHRDRYLRHSWTSRISVSSYNNYSGQVTIGYQASSNPACGWTGPAAHSRPTTRLDVTRLPGVYITPAMGLWHGAARVTDQRRRASTHDHQPRP
jgi:hypothetical protein